MRLEQRKLALCVVGVIFSALGGCSDPKAQLTSDAEKGVRSLLTDPQSAQFQNETLHPVGKNPETVCGEVNARNRMGGYNGFRKFYYVISSQEAQIKPEEGVSLTELDKLKEVNNDAEFVLQEAANCDLIDHHGSRQKALESLQPPKP